MNIKDAIGIIERLDTSNSEEDSSRCYDEGSSNKSSQGNDLPYRRSAILSEVP